MKIAIVSSVCNTNSGARAPIDLAIALSKTHQVSFFASEQNKNISTYKLMKHNRIEIFLIKPSKIPIIGLFNEMWQLTQLLKNNRPDIICFHGRIHLFFATKITFIPVVLGYHGTQFDVVFERYLKRNIFLSVINFMANLIIYIVTWINVKLADEVVAISKYAANEIQHLYGRKCYFVYNGCSPLHFSKKIKLTKKKSKIINILSVSRITPYKQFEKIIYAINNLSNKFTNIQLIISGSSPQPKYLEFLKFMHTKRMKIIIEPTDNQLINLYKQCDVYITADRYLFFGMPVLEAATFKKPSLAYNYAAAKEIIIHGKTGYIAKTDREFTEYLQKLIRSDKTQKKMGASAYQYSLNFSWDQQAAKWINIFKMVLKKYQYA